MSFGVIYLLTNTVNGRMYVGQTTRSSLDRWDQHCADARSKKVGNKIHSAIRKHGVKAFEVSELALADSQEELDNLEKKYIAELGTLSPGGYNLTLGGHSGRLHSPDTKQKMRLLKLGKPLSPEHRAKIGFAHRGKPVTLERGRSISLAKRGKPQKPEVTARMRATCSILTDDLVREILLDMRSGAKIAAQYQISKSAVWNIKHRCTWKHVHFENPKGEKVT